MDYQLISIGTTVVAAIIGANYLVSRDVKADLKGQISKVEEDLKDHINKLEQKFENKMEKFEERLEKSDARWFALFERFHILDKDIAKSQNEPA